MEQQSAEQVNEHREDHQIGGPRVNRSDQPTELYFGHKKLDRFKGLAGAGTIIEQEKNPCGDLNHEQEKCHAAEIIPKRVTVYRHLFLLCELGKIA